MNSMNKNLHIAIVSNIIFEPYFASLSMSYFGKNTKVFFIPFDEHKEEEYQEKLINADLIVIWLNFEVQFLGLSCCEEEINSREVVALYKKLYTNIANVSHARILWFLFEDYNTLLPNVVGHVYKGFVDRLNMTLRDTLNDQVSFIDLKHLIAEIGIEYAYDMKGKYRWNAPYSKTLIEVAIKEIHKQYLIEKGITKKCLILDCDGVLWGGILSEVSIENIKLGGSRLGRLYQDFQRFVLSLYYHGVIIAICSKNDLIDVLTVFREHNEMILKEENIACFKVDWNNKVENIKQVAETLNIGLESIVFVDDSVIEIEAVKAMLPLVTPILFKRDMVYEQFSCFNLKNNVVLEDINKRNECYRTDEFRKELKVQYTDFEDYINALQMKIDIHKATPSEYSRISELTQRTNKCTNGKRYTIDKIKERVLQHEVILYTVSVSDRFSNLGLVGAIEVEKNCLTLFSLSCRALGRNIENKMFDFIFSNHCIKTADFISTNKNKDILEKLNFRCAVHILVR